MAERIFDIGDVIVIKSGGPEMTVKNYAPKLNIGGGEDRSDTDVICLWNDGRVQTLIKRFIKNETDRNSWWSIIGDSVQKL